MVSNEKLTASRREALRQELTRTTAHSERDPKNAGGYWGHVIYRDLGQSGKGAGRVQAGSWRLDPEHIEAYHHRGHVHERLKQFDRARDNFDAAVKQKSDIAHFHDRRRSRRLPACGTTSRPLCNALGAYADPGAETAADRRRGLAWLYVMGPEKLRNTEEGHASRRAGSGTGGKTSIHSRPWAQCNTGSVNTTKRSIP